jgi:hypothetical protein
MATNGRNSAGLNTYSVTFKPNNLVIDMRAREWCKLPYLGHPKGCPNYGKRNSCPPLAPLIHSFIDISRDMTIVIVEFNLQQQISYMLKLHPEWSDRQARCCLYWQGRVRRELHQAMSRIIESTAGLKGTDSPEAMGVQVIRTVKGLGFPISPQPKERVYKVGLIGYAV